MGRRVPNITEGLEVRLAKKPARPRLRSRLPPDLLRLQILSLLCAKPQSGYSLKSALKETFMRNVSYGTLYPNLYSLEKERFVSREIVQLSREKSVLKSIYCIEESGKVYLRRELERLKGLISIMSGIQREIGMKSV
jgi:DNA-binding PadR family transcriptional regulator